MQKTSPFMIVILLLLVSNIALADAPVVDLSQSNGTVQPTEQSVSYDAADAASQENWDTPIQQSLSLDQRVTRLQNQINNFANMDLPGKIADLQQQLQQLQGQLQVQQRDLKILDEQQRNFYQDLDQRLTDLKSLVEQGAPPSNSNLRKATTHLPSKVNKELKAYQAAFKFVRLKAYNKAVSSLQNFLKVYPNSNYVVNAHYWLGEIYYIKGKKDQAREEFQTVIYNYPNSHKVSAAMLKYGYILRDQGDPAAARLEFKKIIKKYPNTSAARLAKLQIDEVKFNQPPIDNS